MYIPLRMELLPRADKASNANFLLVVAIEDNQEEEEPKSVPRLYDFRAALPT